MSANLKSAKEEAHSSHAAYEFIERYYNRLRLHSALGYRPPEEFEQQAERQNQTADLNVAAVILRFGKSLPGDTRRPGDNRETESAQVFPDEEGTERVLS